MEQLNREQIMEQVKQVGQDIKTHCDALTGSNLKVDFTEELISEVTKDPELMSLTKINQLRITMWDTTEESTEEYYEEVINYSDLEHYLKVTRGLYDLCNLLDNLVEI